MTYRRVLFVMTVLAIAGAFLAGFWPERQRLEEAQAEVQSLAQRAQTAEGAVRLGEVLGQLLRVSDAIAASNFGDAALQASLYFDRVANEIPRAQPDAQGELQAILRTRDTVTAALARTEPSVTDLLEVQEIALRRALGYSIP